MSKELQEEMTGEECDAWLQKHFPWIAWRDPIVVRTPDYSGLGCRLCIARVGLKATEAREKLFATLVEFIAHMREKHETRMS